MAYRKDYRQLPNSVKRTLLHRYKECRKCGSTQDLEVDHIIPDFEGGSGAVENLQVLCHTCHMKKTQSEAARARSQYRQNGLYSESHPFDFL